MTHPGTTQAVKDGVIFRTTAEEENEVFGATNQGIWWKIFSSTWMNADTGDQKIQIRHWLQMDIMATDTIEFEVSFRPNSKPTAASNTVIGEDYFTCKLTRDTDDVRFWTADISEGYYQCQGTDADNGFGQPDTCDNVTYSS